MGIFDRQVSSKVSECKLGKNWQICIYCNMPFQTDTFEKKCSRCKYFDVHLTRLKSKFMLFYIVTSLVTAVFYIFFLIRVIKITEKFEFLLLFMLFPTIFIGMLMWMIVNKYKD